ncbi:O-antigen ligase family protein [Zoogloea sp.]|uniref:O-antigen ligase family protein n=1 Tax=Zoogloea sp. TaxID=49181 RepID=UPI0035B2D328
MSIFIRLMLLGLAFLALFKDDSSVIENSEFWTELEWDPISMMFKKVSLYVGLLGAAAGCALILMCRKKVVRLGSASLPYLGLLLYVVFRVAVEGESAAGKYVLGFVLMLVLLVAIEFYISNFGVGQCVSELSFSLGVVAIFYVLLNFVGMVMGYGYVPGNPRFFGTSSHPNFIGVQLALCDLTLLYLLNRSRSVSAILVVLVLLAVGLYMQAASGSRTGLAVFAVGLVFWMLASRGFKLKASLIYAMIVFGVLCLAGYLYFFADIADAFDRGDHGYDTRSEVWAALLKTSLENPIFGTGYFIAASENSYLRGAAAYGVPYALVLVGVVCKASFDLYRGVRISSRIRPELALFLSYLMALSAGGVLEGYLIDTLSYQILVFVLSLSVASRGLAKSVRRV